jgi:tetratricopeptide (TPR) repeat protein
MWCAGGTRCFFLHFAETLAPDASVGGTRRITAVDVLRGEYANLRVALQWALDAGEPELGLRLAGTLQFLWRFRLLPAEEGLLWIERLLSLPGADAPTPARAVALLTEAWLIWRLDVNAANALYAEALTLARRLAEPRILFAALSDRGLVAMHRGEYRTARSCWEEALPGTVASGDRAAQAILLSNLGRVAILEGDLAGGRTRCQEILRLGQELGDDWTIGLALESLRMAAQSVGNLAEARALATECLRLFHGAPFPTGNTLRALGQIDIAEGHYEKAREHLGRALTMGHDGALPSIEAGVVDTLAGLAARVGQPELSANSSVQAYRQTELCYHLRVVIRL